MNNCKYGHAECINRNLKPNQNGIMMCPVCLDKWRPDATSFETGVAQNECRFGGDLDD